jgi:outer membrane immunogenic protein
MKRSVSSTAAILAALIALPLATAQAADMMIYKAPPPQPTAVAAWGGCYVGANYGGGWNSMDFTLTSPTADFGRQSANGVIGGGQLGCDYQINSQWVVGVKGQYDFADMNSQNILPAAPTFYMNNTLHDIATATGRVGYLVTPSWLVYGQGGGAWVRDHMDVYGFGPPAFLSESATSNRYGYDAGGGVEYMFAPNWSAFAEYNYLGFGTHSSTFDPGGQVIAVKQNVQTAMLGVNWRFTMPAVLRW